MSESAERIDPGTGIGLGSVFASVGLLVVLVAFDVVPVDESSVHSPRWVIGLIGLAFALAGVVVLGYGIRNALDPEAPDREGSFSPGSWLAGSAICTIFALVTSWIAVGSGPRGVGTRIVFGLCAVMCGAIAVDAWVRGARRIVGGSGRAKDRSREERTDPASRDEEDPRG